jgi:hypothetical protein
VTLEDDAAEIIGAAWRNGLIPADDLLALPAPPPPPAPVPGKLGELLDQIPLWDVPAFLAWRTHRADATADTLTEDEARYAAGYLNGKLRETDGDGETAAAGVFAEYRGHLERAAAS